MQTDRHDRNIRMFLVATVSAISIASARAQPIQVATGNAYDPVDLLPMFDGGRWDDGGLDVGDGFRVPYIVLVPTDRPRRDVVVATGVIGAQRIAATVVGPFAPPLVVVPVER